MKRFFDRPDTKWRNLSGALHLYALPDETDPVLSRLSQEDARVGQWPGLSLQPPRFIHMTMQRLDLYREDLDQVAWERMLESLGRVSSSIDPFSIHFARPCIRDTAVEALGEPVAQWQKAVAAIRGALCSAGLESALTDEPFGPHYTFAYCRKDTSSSQDVRLAEDLERNCEPHTWQVNTIYLVAVKQYLDEGVFRFERLHCWPLGI